MKETELDFQQIHDAYRPRIARYLARLAGEDEAEDLCQEVFARVDRGLGSFRGEAALSTWIYRIATNAFHDRLRSRSYKQRQMETASPAEELERLQEVPDGDERPPSAEQQVIREEMIECIRGYIDQLPEDYRLVLLLSEEEGFRNREIADILEISLDSVKIRLHRARARLKDLLQGHCTFYLDERSEVACDRRQDDD